MKELSFEKMEEVNGGKMNVCDAIFFGTGAALGLAVAVYTAGTAAVAGWALTTYIAGIGAIAC